jgi:hypothetical protein
MASFNVLAFLTKLLASFIEVTMGRPPLNVKDIKIRLSPETLERIKSLVGNYKIAAFIREAIERELTRREADAGSDQSLQNNPSEQ